MTAEANGPRTISVVIPAYRSTETLRTLASELSEVLSTLVDDYEIILVDDGSGGATWDTIESIASASEQVCGVRLARNYGQHSALLAGIRCARHAIVVTMDDDLQHPPSEIPRLLEQLGPDIDLVYGSPIEERQTAVRNAASRVSKRIMASALGPDVYPAVEHAFRLFRRNLIDAAIEVHDPSISIDVLLSWATTRVIDTPVAYEARTNGQSGYTVRGLVRHALNMVTGYSTRPLHWVSVCGFVCALFGFGLLMLVIVRFLIGDADVAGFTFLAAALTLFSGVQLLSLGVVGEYLGRVHFRTMGRPPYVIATRTSAEHDTSVEGGPPSEEPGTTSMGVPPSGDLTDAPGRDATQPPEATQP